MIETRKGVFEPAGSGAETGEVEAKRLKIGDKEIPGWIAVSMPGSKQFQILPEGGGGLVPGFQHRSMGQTRSTKYFYSVDWERCTRTQFDWHYSSYAVAVGLANASAAGDYRSRMELSVRWRIDAYARAHDAAYNALRGGGSRLRRSYWLAGRPSHASAWFGWQIG